MSDIADLVIAEVEARCDEAIGATAGFLVGRLFEILSVQAPVVAVGGRIYATVQATPGAPPRRVTGNLQAHVGLDRLGLADWVLGVRETVPYSRWLELESDHVFFRTVVDQHAADADAILAGRLREGGGP